MRELRVQNASRSGVIKQKEQRIQTHFDYKTKWNTHPGKSSYKLKNIINLKHIMKSVSALKVLKIESIGIFKPSVSVQRRILITIFHLICV
jgi:hypothetical protein